MKRGSRKADRLWQLMVAMVMDTRGDWKKRVAEATGLRFSRVRALRRLSLGPRTMRDLATALDMDAPATTVSINDLEDRGLVERRTHPADRRAKLVSLTPSGRRLLASVRKVSDEPPDALATLPAGEVTKLLRLLEAHAPRTRSPRKSG